jgi:SWI/SNF-related matrix-associated actin-dependent regulator of chromatin subfamily A3
MSRNSIDPVGGSGGNYGDEELPSVNGISDRNSKSSSNQTETMDLSQSDDEEDETQESHGQDRDETPQHFQRLGSVQFTIVGMRYYSGVAHAQEYVTLVREPQNPYDANAIRVENLGQEKVGHVKATQAALLAPMMDSFVNELMVEASVLDDARKTYSKPVHIELYAVGQTEEELAEHSQQLQDILAGTFKGSRKFGLKWHLPHPNSRRSRDIEAAATPSVTRKQVDWRHQAEELDKLFDKQSAEQLQNLPTLGNNALCKLLTPLFDYQLTGVRWMLCKEQLWDNMSSLPFYKKVHEKGQDAWMCTITNASQIEPPKHIMGGIQADEMGLGKTISLLALLLANPPASRKNSLQGMKESGSGDEDNAKPVASTKRLTMPTVGDLASVKVGELRSNLKSAGVSTKGMKKAEVIDRCIKALEAGELSMDSFGSFQKVSQTSAFLATNVPICTLIVCPVSVMSNWVTQIDEHVAADTLRLGTYQGQRRQELLPLICTGEVDIILTSYQTLASEYTKVFGKKAKTSSGNEDSKPPAKRFKEESIFDSLFYRIVLDEGHAIRSCTSRVHNAVCQIQAERKWILTGTPFVNRYSDIHSLFSFLGVQPLGDSAIFKRAITVPMQSGGQTADLAMAQLRTTMAHVALRRSKATAGVQLVEKSVQIASIEFRKDSSHHIVYNALFGSLRLAFQAILDENQTNTLGFKLYNCVFERLLRLRQACCSARLLTPERRDIALKMWEHLQQKEASGAKLTAQEGRDLLEKLKGAFSQDELHECAICLEEMERAKAVILKTCQHVFCNPCMDKVLTMNSGSKCPLCRKTFQKSDMICEAIAQEAAMTKLEDPSPKACLKDESIGPSPKILALLEAIKAMQLDEKGVIFSQFTSFLDLIQSAMQDAGHSFTRLDGRMTGKRRTEAVRDFSSTDPDSPRFILCSLHAAGVGTNLTRANHAFMMDTWFNESIENQAMDRIHRIGQTRPVHITRFVMKGSVEERMITLQETKSLQAKGSIEKLKPEEQRKARLSDLRGLLLLDKPRDD